MDFLKERKHLLKLFLFFFCLFCLFSIFKLFFKKEEFQTRMVNVDVFLKEKNILLEKGYTIEEIELIYEFMSQKNINKILEHDYVDLHSFFGISNFDFGKVDDYLNYQLIENIPMKDIVTRVNLKLNTPFYTDKEEISNPDSVLVFVNKYFFLNETYIPEDLVSIPSFPHLQLRSVVIDPLEKLLLHAMLDQVILIPYSAYRDYQYQQQLYLKYLEKDSIQIVDSYSARPGHSEHQTGLAIDIRSSSHWYNLTTEDYKWIQENAYKYGFIIRYPKDSSFITGYKEEPWHLRYVGEEHARKIHDLHITFDEYVDIYLRDY